MPFVRQRNGSLDKPNSVATQGHSHVPTRSVHEDHRWIRAKSVFDADYEAVLVITARRDRLDTQIEAMAADSEFAPLVRRLCCLRGIATLTGFALAVEIGDWTRFTGASIGSFIGLVPTEHSSGASRAQGPITKTGNGHVRRARRGRLAPSHPLRNRQ